MQGEVIHTRNLRSRVGTRFRVDIRRLGRRRFIVEIKHPTHPIRKFAIYQSLREAETVIAKALIKAEVARHARQKET